MGVDTGRWADIEKPFWVSKRCRGLCRERGKGWNSHLGGGIDQENVGWLLGIIKEAWVMLLRWDQGGTVKMACAFLLLLRCAWCWLWFYQDSAAWMAWDRGLREWSYCLTLEFQLEGNGREHIKRVRDCAEARVSKAGMSLTGMIVRVG